MTSRPASAEVFRRGIGKFGFKIREAAERFGDCGRQFAFRFAAGVRRRAVPVEGVVPDLRCVVEYAAFRRADDLFEGFAFERSAFDQVVEVSDIRTVVFTVVIFGVSAEMCGAGASFAYGNAGNSNDIATLLITFCFISH